MSAEPSRILEGTRHAKRAVTPSSVRLGVLLLLWLGSALTYYVFLLRPYGLLNYYATPKLSLGVIGRHGPHAASGFLLCILVTFLLYALAYRACRNWRSALGAGACILMGALTTALLATTYPIGATDVFDYVAEGELLALHGLNPMVYPAATVPDLPFINYAPYNYTVSPYGPIWIWLEAAVVRVAGHGGLLPLLLGFKALAILGYLVACALVVALLRRRAPQAMVAGLVAFAWNPLVLTEVAVNAHNDIWMGALILCGVLFWELRRPLPMLAAFTLAFLIKAPAAPLLPLFALAAWRQESPARRRRLAVSGMLLVTALVTASYLSLPLGLQGIASMLRRSEYFTHSLPAVCKLALELIVPQGTAARLVGAASAGVFAAYVLRQLRNAWRRPNEAVRLGFNALLFLLLVCIPWFQPWYLLCLMPLAAVYPRRDAPFQVALSTLCVMVSYVMFGFVWFWWPPFREQFLGINIAVLVTSYGLPWAYALWSGWKGRKSDSSPDFDSTLTGLSMPAAAQHRISAAPAAGTSAPEPPQSPYE